MQEKAWDRVNNVVIGWLLAVLDQSIAKSVIWYSTVREIWVEVDERYGQTSIAQLFAVLGEVNSSSQSQNMTVAEYFTKLKSILDELNNISTLPSCTYSNCTC